MPASCTGARLLVGALVRHGVDHVFCLPGESFLGVLDALRDAPGVRVVTCRHEGGAAMMAEADAKLTQRPGVAMVTRGPGAANAIAGLFVAKHDSTPLVLFVGLPPRALAGRGAFQEIELERLFAPLAKYVAVIDRAERVPELVARAFATASAGRPGPVVLGLPEDMQAESASVEGVEPMPVARAAPDPSAVAEIVARLERAERPLAIVGGGGWTAAATDALVEFASMWAIPVASAFRRQDFLDNTHACYAGHLGLALDPKLAERVKSADLVLALGTRLGEVTTSRYTLLDAPDPRQTLIHLHADAEELGRVYRTALAVVASSGPALAALAAVRPRRKPVRRAWLHEAHADYLAHSTPGPERAMLDLAHVVAGLNKVLPADAIVTNGAGNYAAWVNRYCRYRSFGSQLAPTSGSMGYGLPAAIAAKLRAPERVVVAWAGDGCFQISQQELATAAQEGAAVILLVVNNSSYGTIRMHQEKIFPGRIVATELVNPDFVALARAYGLYAERVEETRGFPAAFVRARASGGPALIELKTAIEAISPSQTLSTLRGAKRRGRRAAL
ncbi:MAG: thiamine pyrophosphate-binding protein [Alphaproteobacteria bacterium]|nr:thiamine pyrophosphate-binding protein [Alphaproteobacteria bacterium]